MVTNNEKNRRKLAETIVGNWESLQIRCKLVDALIADYQHDNRLFISDWISIFDDEEDN